MKLKGFTLIEVLVTALLAGFIGMGSIYVISQSNRSLTDGAVEIFKNANAQRIMDQIAKDVHQGTKMQASGSTLLITDLHDKPMFRWYVTTSSSFADWKLNREVYYDDGTMTSKEILLISSHKRKMVPYANFHPSTESGIAGKYYDVNASVYILEVVENQSMYSSYTIFENKLYCRLNPNAD